METIPILYLFLIHILLWGLYILFTPSYPSMKRLKTLQYKGDIKNEIHKYLQHERISGIQLHLARNYHASYNIKEKKIFYTQDNNHHYNADDLITGIHEAAHAVQEQQKYWATSIRKFWNHYCKSVFFILFLFLFVYAIFCSVFWGWNGLWNMVGLFILFHYLYCFFIVLPSEWDAHQKSMQYILKHYSFSKQEEKWIKKSCYESMIDYFINIPILLVYG